MSERVTIRVDESDKEQWQERVANSPEYESLTHLIELAVHRELNGMYNPTAGSSNSEKAGGGYSPDVTNSEIQQTLEGLVGDIDTLATEMGIIGDELQRGPELGQYVFEQLPESKENAKSPEEITEAVEETVMGDMVRVCHDLEATTGRVKSTDNGKLWKEV